MQDGAALHGKEGASHATALTFGKRLATFQRARLSGIGSWSRPDSAAPWREGSAKAPAVDIETWHEAVRTAGRVRGRASYQPGPSAMLTRFLARHWPMLLWL